MDQKTLSKTPIPESQLYLPKEFWFSLLASLDAKVEAVSKTYGYGVIELKLVVHRGKVTDVYLHDEVRIRGVVEKEEEFDKIGKVWYLIIEFLPESRRHTVSQKWLAVF